MKKKIFFVLLSINLVFILGCGGGSGGGSSNTTTTPTPETNTSNDVVLTKGESITCSEASSFSVIPNGEPSVDFSKNVENREVTITLKENSSGSVTIENCTKV